MVCHGDCIFSCVVSQGMSGFLITISAHLRLGHSYSDIKKCFPHENVNKAGTNIRLQNLLPGIFLIILSFVLLERHITSCKIDVEVTLLFRK